MTKEICQDCERIFEPKSSKAMICPKCHRKRLSEAAKARNLNKLGNDAYSKHPANGKLTMCNNCMHKPVCGKFLATGGHVNSCEHHEEGRSGRCDWCESGKELCGTCQKFFDYYGDGGSDKCSACLDDPRCSHYKPVNF